MGAITENEWRYNQLIKQFPSDAEPAFEDPDLLAKWWGRNWGCTNDVGRLRVVLMHRPGAGSNVVDTSKRLDNNAFGDEQAGWYCAAPGPGSRQHARAARCLFGCLAIRGGRGGHHRRAGGWANEDL